MALVFALNGNLSAGQSSWWPDLLGLAAGMMWGLTTVVIRSSKLAQCGAEKLLFYQLAVSAFVFLTPVFTLVFAALWLGEPVTAPLVASLCLVALGIFLVNRR